jgi:hypothetical protein
MSRKDISRRNFFVYRQRFNKLPNKVFSVLAVLIQGFAYNQKEMTKDLAVIAIFLL